jgi:protein TonB
VQTYSQVTAEVPLADTVATTPVGAPTVAEQKPVYDLPPAAEPELFSHIYGRDRKPAPTEEEEEEKTARFDYRLIAVPVLLALIVFLSYQQRRSARDFFAMVREMVGNQIAQLWPSDKESKSAVRRTTEPAKPTNARKRSPAKIGQGRVIESARAARAVRVPLRVRVEGQPEPLVTPAVARFVSPIPFQRSISVGITGAAFSAPVPPSPMRVQIAPTESLSLLLKQIPPIYPAAAREAKIEGSVVLNAVINKDGNVGELSVVSGNPMLVQAAIDAVKQWVYRPYYRGGVPMDVETLVVVEFSLASERAAVGGGN